jgi:uncharacterized RDD family membrane protein YckC
MKLELSNKNIIEATFKQRAIALILDGFTVSIVAQISSSLADSIFKFITSGFPVLSILLGLVVSLLIIPYLYYVIPLSRYGQTFGKRVVGIKVVSLNGEKQLSTSTCIKREFIGKSLSSIAFMIGYLVYLSGRPTWHDSIAKTKVIAIN